ncbi:RidA family protein [Pseudomonas sp. NPDC089569]|uniref:RidA family protein n=1 Tax=Pseudomonas sp. NPDC089569 TaxID=3390722 RepID=UPI003D05A81C
MIPANLPFAKTRNINGFVFVSGEVPFGEDGSIPYGLEAQTDLTFARIAKSLSTEGLTLDDIVSVTVYLTDPKDFQEFNAAYAKHFKGPLPTRTTVCAQLMIDARVELTVIAAART